MQSPADRLGTEREVPGEEIIWVLILGEMTIFALCFVIYLYFRQLSPDLYLTSQTGLIQGYGFFNTLVLITSSFCVANALKAFRVTDLYLVRRFLLAAWLLGALFCFVKVREFQIMASRGLQVETNEFFTFYYVLTGIHLMHVLIGMIVLAYFFYVFSAKGATAAKPKVFESGTGYWHMIDIVWILLFSLIYLLS